MDIHNPDLSVCLSVSLSEGVTAVLSGFMETVLEFLKKQRKPSVCGTVRPAEVCPETSLCSYSISQH